MDQQLKRVNKNSDKSNNQHVEYILDVNEEVDFGENMDYDYVPGKLNL